MNSQAIVAIVCAFISMCSLAINLLARRRRG